MACRVVCARVTHDAYIKGSTFLKLYKKHVDSGVSVTLKCITRFEHKIMIFFKKELDSSLKAKDTG